MLRKMSVKTVMTEYGIKGWETFKEGEKKKFLFSVGGKAVGVKKGEGTFGGWTAFTGEFVAVVPGNEPLEAVRLFIPEPIQSLIESNLSNATGGIEFAVNVFIRRPTEDENVKYVYVLEPVIKPTENPMTKRILASITESHKTQHLLPAPKAEVKTPPKK